MFVIRVGLFVCMYITTRYITQSLRHGVNEVRQISQRVITTYTTVY